MAKVVDIALVRATKAATAVDRVVGLRLRERRTALGMNQTELGARVGVTFQQIQKYERGANRIGASRLFQFAKELQVPIEYFYKSAGEQKPSGAGKSAAPLPKTAGPELESLTAAFKRISSPRIRKAALQLVQLLASESPKS